MGNFTYFEYLPPSINRENVELGPPGVNCGLAGYQNNQSSRATVIWSNGDPKMYRFIGRIKVHSAAHGPSGLHSRWATVSESSEHNLILFRLFVHKTTYSVRKQLALLCLSPISTPTIITKTLGSAKNVNGGENRRCGLAGACEQVNTSCQRVRVRCLMVTGKEDSVAT